MVQIDYQGENSWLWVKTQCMWKEIPADIQYHQVPHHSTN